MRTLFIVCLALAIASCGGDSPPAPEPPAKIVPPSPTGSPDGTACAMGSDCLSGNCEFDDQAAPTTGICCDQPCGGLYDCRSCLAKWNESGTDGKCDYVRTNSYPCQMGGDERERAWMRDDEVVDHVRSSKVEAVVADDTAREFMKARNAHHAPR